MATDLSSLVPATTRAVALANLVLVSPQKVVGYQPQYQTDEDDLEDITDLPESPRLLFHYDGEQSVQLESDITDHFVEDNTAIQDQIALKPEIVNTQGFIGELNNVPPFGLETIKTIVDKLTTVVAYTPGLTVTAQENYNRALALYQVAQNARNSAVSAWATVANKLTGSTGQSTIDSEGLTEESNQNLQQTMFQQFYGYWRSRTLFTVQTPWAVFQNMAIWRLRPVQDADSRVMTTFEVTFKMIRMASTTTELPVKKRKRAKTQTSSLQDNGTSTPTSSISLNDGIDQMIA